MRRLAPTGRGRAAGALVTLALLLTACNADADPGAAPTTPNTQPPLAAPSPTPDPPPTLTTEDAEAAAQEAVKDYLALFAQISADPDRDVTELEQVADGRALDWATHQITTWRAAGHTGVGAQVATEFTATSVELEPDNDSKLDYPMVELTACVDVSDTDLVDDDGNSAVPAGRLDRVLVDYTVWNIGWPNDHQWRVIADNDQLTDTDPPEFVPCA